MVVFQGRTVATGCDEVVSVSVFVEDPSPFYGSHPCGKPTPPG